MTSDQGTSNGPARAHALALPAGTVLADEYRIVSVLGAGGFGITYLAEELKLAPARQVTIKEYFPTEYSVRTDDVRAVPLSSDCSEDFAWGLKRFIDEAQALARFDHPNINRVYRYFEANDTAYIVLQHEPGGSFRDWLKALGRTPRQKELDAIVAPLLDALETVHDADFLHRDIAPDNIIIRPDGSPVLIDFGSARGEIAHRSRALSALVKPGYSPFEQYGETSARQGAWTDVYAFAAMLFHAVSGKRPDDAPARLAQDDVKPARDVALGSFRPGFLAAIDAGLVLDAEKRPQSIGQWRKTLMAPAPSNGLFGWGTRKLPQDQSSPVDQHEGADPETVLATRLAEAPTPLRDRLAGAKSRSGPKPPVAEAADAAATAAAPRRRLFSRGNASTAAQPKPQPAAPPPARKAALPAIRKPPKPRRQPRKLLRRAGTRLAMGAAVAAGVIALQQSLPEYVITGENIASSASTAPSFLQKRFKPHAAGTNHVRFAHGSTWLVTTGADKTLKVWGARWGNHIRTLELDDGQATALSVQGQRAVTGHDNGAVALWDLESGERLARFQRNEARIWSVVFLDRGKTVAAAGHDWTVALWDRAAPSEPIHLFAGHDSATHAVAFDRARAQLVSASADKTVKLWDQRRLSLKRTYRGHKDFVTAVAFADDGTRFVSGDLAGEIRVWSTRSAKRIARLRGHEGEITGLAFLGAGDRIASTSTDGRLRIWDARRGRSTQTFGSDGQKVVSMSVDKDASRVVTASDDGWVRIWNIAQLKS
ncbi:MAG: serine/threonine-protein kinase [Pseudomonadota bacterium]